LLREWYRSLIITDSHLMLAAQHWGCGYARLKNFGLGVVGMMNKGEGERESNDGTLFALLDWKVRPCCVED